MTPLGISMILHFYATPEPYPSMEFPSQQEVVKSFIENGILLESGTNFKKYKVTRKGEAWIKMLLKTPYPKRIWIDPRDIEE